MIQLWLAPFSQLTHRLRASLPRLSLSRWCDYTFKYESFLTSASDSVVFPYFLVPAFIIGFAYRELAIGYLNTGRDLRRMESNTRSPIFSDFGEILEGIVTVRAFSAEKMFLNNVFVKIDATTKVGFYLLLYAILEQLLIFGLPDVV